MNTYNKEKLIGVILAGGKGSRLDGMGKFNQKFNNNTLYFLPLNLPIIVKFDF